MTYEESSAGIPDKEAIRRELEWTKTAYHELLDSLSPEDWKKKTANSSWNVRQLMWHIAWGNSFTVQGVDQCRKGKGFNPPMAIVDPLNSLWTRINSRSATPESVAKTYDDVHEKILACLNTVQDDEWQKSARSFGNDMTVESCFHEAKKHFDEHSADILKGLGRS
jgi:hypothetical protein